MTILTNGYSFNIKNNKPLQTNIQVITVLNDNYFLAFDLLKINKINNRTISYYLDRNINTITQQQLLFYTILIKCVSTKNFQKNDILTNQFFKQIETDEYYASILISKYYSLYATRLITKGLLTYQLIDN